MPLRSWKKSKTFWGPQTDGPNTAIELLLDDAWRFSVSKSCRVFGWIWVFLLFGLLFRWCLKPGSKWSCSASLQLDVEVLLVSQSGLHRWATPVPSPTAPPPRSPQARSVSPSWRCLRRRRDWLGLRGWAKRLQPVSLVTAKEEDTKVTKGLSWEETRKNIEGKMDQKKKKMWCPCCGKPK